MKKVWLQKKKRERNSDKTSPLSLFRLIQRDGVVLLFLDSWFLFLSFILTSKLDLEDKSCSAEKVAAGERGEVS